LSSLHEDIPFSELGEGQEPGHPKEFMAASMPRQGLASRREGGTSEVKTPLDGVWFKLSHTFISRVSWGWAWAVPTADSQTAPETLKQRRALALGLSVLHLEVQIVTLPH